MLKLDHKKDVMALRGIRQTAQRPTRRAVLGLGIGIGYAAAALPVAAQTQIHTSSTGLDTGEAMVAVKEFEMPVFYARRQGKSGLPVVLVLSEVFGVHEYIADVARRLAHAGYFAIAPELFERQGDPQGYGTLNELMDQVISKVPDQQVMGDLDAAVRWAEAQGADISRLAVTGFCWGGRQTWMYAAHQPQVKAAVAWYGRLAGEDSELMPKQVLDVAAEINAPVLGLYGGDDPSIPIQTIEQMKKKLLAAGESGNDAAKKSEFVIYPEAPHAFHADYRPSYLESSAKDGWERMLKWFQQHGVTASA